MTNMGVDYLLSVFTLFAVTLIVTIGLSYLYYRYVETRCNMMINRLLNNIDKWIFPQSERIEESNGVS